MKARLFTLSILALAACRDASPPGELSGPHDPSKMISDGAHGGNKDFFFLPPMVPDPSKDPNYEAGQFNSTLAPSLTVEICQLQSSPVDAAGQPVVTDCVAGPPVKKFPAGSVTLQNPPDGFYQVLWNAGASNLDVTKFYRIKVLVEGSSTPFGVADIDAVSNMKELRNARTGETIPLNENSTLPIKFRIEHGGGTALCGAAALCASTIITANSPAGFQTLTVDGGAGAIAGVKFPNGWLPANGPQSVVVTVAQVDLGTTDPVTGAETTPCHVGLPLQQFGGCFRFTTTPQLQPIDESGAQFAVPVIAAVCYVLYGTGDPREKFAEMYASGPNEPPHALEDASDVGILAPNARNCSTSTEVIGEAGSNSLTRFANATWRSVKSGAGRLFGVKTAYAIDLGLGGSMKGFSNVGPALNATIEPVGPTEITLPGGGNFQAFIRIVGSNHHDGQHQNSVGIGGLPVQFQVAAQNGTLAQLGDEIGGATTLAVTTNDIAVDPESPVSGGGYAAVNWQVPTSAGTYQLTANGAAFGGPITFNVTVTSTIAQLRSQAFDNFAIAYRGNGNGGTTEGVSEGQINMSALLSDEFSHTETFPTRLEIDQRSIQTDNLSVRSVFRDLQRARGSLDYAIAQSAALGDAAPNAGDLIVLSAYADVLAAENWCSGVPTSQIDAAGTMTYGRQQTTQELLTSASAKFDTVMAIAATNPNFAGMANIARIGRARALLDMNDPSGATEFAIQVPTAFSFTIGASASIASQNNGVFKLANGERRWSVTDNEGINGLPYRTDADPRVGFALNGIGFDLSTPIYMQQKYTSLAAPTPLAQGVEARLIEAEFYLRQGNFAAMAVSMNAARTQLGLAPLPPFTDGAQAFRTLFKERAYTLWLTSHRLGDLRREIRQYDVGTENAFPTGEYPKGGVYGTDVNFPIPVDPQFNPAGLACLSNGA
jgi:hypothetical protein